jgi:LysR family transcriptional activator of glutamate synthase operon
MKSRSSLALKEPRIQQFRALVHIARHGSFVNAGDAVGMARSSVWRQIRALERDTGSKLIEVNGRKVKVTPEGAMLAEIVAPMIEDFEKVVPEFARRKEEATRTLRIAAPPQILAHELPKALSYMRDRHTGLRMIITSVTSGTALDQLLNNEADVAVVGHMERLKDESAKLLAVPMTTFPMVALLPPKHPLNFKKKLTLQDLVTQPLLLPPQRSSSRPQIDAAFSRHGLLAQMHVALEANVFHVVLPYVTLGFGTAILGASRNYIEGELKNRSRDGEVGLRDVSHLFGDEKVFFLTRRTRVRQPHIEELCQLLCHSTKS